MNKNIIHNTAYNYLSGYHLSMEHLEEMKKLMVERINTKFYLKKSLCELAPNCHVTNEKCAFIIEIDSEKNKKFTMCF